MLINRVIDKPEYRLKLLTEYIQNHIIEDQIAFTERNETDFTNCDYIIEEKKICKILKISSQTLRNWQKSTHLSLLYCSLEDIINDNVLMNRKLSNFNKIKSPQFRRYCSVRSLLDFLKHENLQKSWIVRKYKI